jgi:IS4 transposase
MAGQVRKGAFYVMDRLYAQRHQFLPEMQEAGADFVVRLNNNVIFTPEGPPRPLRAEDRKAGVVWDRRMRLGVHETGPLLRVVRVEAQDKVFHLATSRQDLEAELIGLIYRQRWEIEVFFKWIKTLLNGGHWFAESPAGAEIQIYCVLVCALLLMLWTGTRPNKRTIEALRFYQMGWATEEELALLLQRAQLAQKKL